MKEIDTNTKQSLVSVIMPTYNHAQYIGEAIDSVLNQTYRNLELIIIDNYSKDNTEKIVASYKDDRIKYLKFKNNGVIAASRNYGIKHSRGEYIAFLDSDDMWEFVKLEKQIPLFEKKPVVGLVYSDAYRINSNGNIIGKFSDDINYFRGKIFHKLLFECFIAPLSSVVMRKIVFHKVGVFSIKYNIFDDYDLYLRIAELFEIDYNCEPLLRYRHHSSNVSKNNLSVKEGLDILDHWLKKKQEIKDSYRDSIGRRKFLLYTKLALSYIYKRDLVVALGYFNQGLKSVRYKPTLIIENFYKYLYLRRFKRFFKKIAYCLFKKYN